MDAPLDASRYDELVDRIAADAAERMVAPDDDDALWEAVTQVVPELTEPVCAAVLEHTEHEPMGDLVDTVTEQRESDDAERRRAQAVTVLLQDVRDRLDDEDVGDPPDHE